MVFPLRTIRLTIVGPSQWSTTNSYHRAHSPNGFPLHGRQFSNVLHISRLRLWYGNAKMREVPAGLPLSSLY